MKKITGIRSIDFKIVARGHGVVNWNGPTSLTGDKNQIINNHSLPKLRGYTNFTGKIKEDTGFKRTKEPTDIDFTKTPLYISQNCIRHHLFREQSFDLHFADNKNLKNVLASITGLVRGYVIPKSQCKRTSSLLLEDFVDQLGNGNFEQMGRSGSKEKGKNDAGEQTASNSFFSKTTFGETEYISYGSISVEQLQFISLDRTFDRGALDIETGEEMMIEKKVQDFIQSLDPKRNPKVTYHSNYVRNGTIFEKGEMGLLLDNEAIDIIVKETLRMITELNIRQAKGYMYVDEMRIDYNDSHKMMRIKRNLSEAVGEFLEPYAVYFYAKS